MLTGDATAGKVNLKNVNSKGNLSGKLTITGTEDSTLDGEVYLSSLTSKNNNLIIPDGSVINVNEVSTKDINSVDSKTGVMYVFQSGKFEGKTYLKELNIEDGASIEFGENFEFGGILNLGNISEMTIGSKMYITQVGNGTNGINNSNKYILNEGTWAGVNTWDAVNFKSESTNVEKNKSLYGDSPTFENGIYQADAGGIFIQGNPTIVFNGGVIWDYSAYAGNFENQASILLNNGETIYRDVLTGDITISNGNLEGKIDIRKGNVVDIVYTTINSSMEPKSYDVTSQGNINIYGGNLSFTQDGAQIKTYKGNIGDINIFGGQWKVGDEQKDPQAPVTGSVTATIINASDSGKVNITGGRFNIVENNTLKLQGASGSIANVSSAFGFQGKGTLDLNFSEFSIDSTLIWEEGIISLSRGELTINSQVSVAGMEMLQEQASLVISGTLSIKNDININGDLSGTGELILAEEADATFGKLVGFGTISLGRGDITFGTGGSSLSVLNGSKGNSGSNININTQTTIGTVNLGYSTLNLREELIVNTLNFDDGKVVFFKKDSPLTLTNSTTIWNTSQIITDSDLVAQAVPGVLYIKDGMILTFADKEGETGHFDSKYLTVNVENGAQAVFSAAETSFDSLKMTQGSASVTNNAVLNVDSVELGDQASGTGRLTIDEGATSNFESLKANKGSVITVNGLLNVQELKAEGSKDERSTLTGTGTVTVTKKADFYGLIENLAHLNIYGTDSELVSANFYGQTLQPDTIGTMEVKYGTVNIGKEGTSEELENLQEYTLTLDSLLLDHGSINLANEYVTLALKQNPSETGLAGAGNSISGEGTLELLNDTSISFGGATQGAIDYLGGLKIGTGTATITANTTLGSIQFSSSQGGILQINENAELILSNEDGTCSRLDNCRITTNAGNLVQGAGKLNLVNGDGSVFGGQVNLGSLDFGNKVAGGTITFNYAGNSQINDFSVNAAGANVVVNNGVLAVANDFGNSETNVYGTGTLFLQTGGTFKNNSGQSLSNLKIGSGTVYVAGANLVNVLFDSASVGELVLTQMTTVTGNITVNAGNALSGSTTLTLSGDTASGTFASDLSGLSILMIQNGATGYINTTNTTTQVGNGAGLILLDNSKLVIGSEATLKVIGSYLGADQSSVISGEGTLDLINTTVNSALIDLNNLTVSSGASKTTQISNLKGNIFVADNATLDFAGGSANQVSIEGTLTVSEDALMPTITFGENGGTLEIDDAKTVTVTNNITVKSNDTLSGTGTLFLDGHSSGFFGMNTAFDKGTIKIGLGTAYIQTDASIGSIGFANAQGGVLDIADGKTLKVGKIETDGNNKISGNGTLNLTDRGSSFKAPIDHLGTLKISGGTAEFYNNINIGTLAFSNGGEVKLISGMTMNVDAMTQSGTNGIVYGEGSFIAGSGNVAFSTGDKNLAAATIGTGVLNFVGNSKIGSLKYSSVEGTINIADNVTVVIGSDFSGIGKLTGADTARLQLEGQAGATFENASGYRGNISAGSGFLTFISYTNFESLNLNSAYAEFYYPSQINTLLISSGLAEFNQSAQINNITISDKGAIYFEDTATLGALNIGSGAAIFAKDSSASNGSISGGGMLDIDVNTLTFNAGDFRFNDNSTFLMRISREATDDQGNVNATGYGKLVFKGGTLDIRNNVNLDITVDYGLQTAESGSVFQLVEGNVNNEFVIGNNRYDFEKVTCSGSTGLCYKITQTSTGGQVAQEGAGNQNQINTAAAFLDGELFDYGTKAFEVAEHLDALSQKKGGHDTYLKALTAVSPDVTGAMTRQPIALHSKVTNTVSSRLNGLMGNMGSSSRTYRAIQTMYGRSGGSPYRSRFMRAQDYYRRAGYYDQDDQPTPRPRPAYRRRIDPDSQEAAETTAERKRWAKRKTSYSQPKEFGLWAQAFYNTADYLSVSKPEGFSGDTTGIAIGADIQLFEVFAIGAGYASTTTTLDSLQRSTDISGNSFFLYGMYKPSDWFVSSVLNMTSMTYEENKDLSGLSLSDNYDGSSFGASIMFGKDLKTWTPAVGLRYVSAGRDAHKDEIGQDISSISTTALTFVAEGRFSHDFAKTNNSLWHSEFSAALTYDFQASGEDAVVNLPNGSTYTVAGDDFDPMGIELGASIAYLLGDHVDISAGYNLEWRPDYMSHSLTAMFRYSF